MHRLRDVPRKGNVDRNMLIATNAPGIIGDVPRKGNVDRNCDHAYNTTFIRMTFPARGTWIEMGL